MNPHWSEDDRAAAYGIAERIRPARTPEPRRFPKTRLFESVLMISGIAIVVLWCLFLLALLVAVTA